MSRDKNGWLASVSGNFC